MKIALINPRIESYSTSLPPLGLLYIGAVLEKEKYDIKIYDPLPNDKTYLEKIIHFNPDIIGVSVLTSYLYRTKYIIEQVREKLKGVIIIIGGVHPTAVPQESFNFLKPDFIVRGEGEYVMRELCLRLKEGKSFENIQGLCYFREGKLLISQPATSIENLDELPLPARHLINFKKYLFPPGVIRGYWSERCTSVMTSRGCPFQCIWCGTQTIFGHKVRRRSVLNVIKELELLIKNYNVDSVWFVDDTFTLDKKWVIEFCNQIITRKIRLKWGCQAHVNTIDEEMLKIMKRAGLIQIDFGVESGSEKVLKALKKGSNIQNIKRAFSITKSLGIRRMATFIFNNPEETEEDIRKTFKIAKEIKPDFVSSFFLTPFPGTELMDIAKERGWLVSDNYLMGGLKKEPLLKIHFTKEKLFKIRRKFQRQFLWTNFFSLIFKPRYLAKIILLFFSYPKGILKGLSLFLKTKVFDDFVFGFLIYYAEKRQQ